MEKGRALLPDHARGHREASRRSTRTGSSSPSSRAPPSATCRRSPAASRSCRSTTTTPSTSPRLDADPPVGSGHYVVADAKPGKSIKYCRNPDYWGKDLPVNVGANNFDCYRLPVFRRQHRRLRGAQGRRLPVPRGVLLRRSGPPPTTSRRCRRAGSSARSSPTTAPRAPRASGSTCAARSCRTRASARRSG